MSQENVKLVRGAFEAFNRGDIEGVVAAFAPDFEYVASGAIPGVRGVYRGLERYKSFLEGFVDEFDDLRVQIHDVTEAGEQVLVSVTLRVRDKKSKGKVAWNASVLWTVRDGKVVRGQGFTSMEEALEAAGLSEEAVSRENIEIVRRLYERVAAGDLEGELELIHPEIQLFPREDEPNARVYRGREGYREYVTHWDEVWDDYRVEIEEYIDAGEYLVVVGRARGKGRSSGLRLEDIQAFEKPTVWLWRFRDGMGIERREYRTKAEALEAAGLSEYR